MDTAEKSKKDRSEIEQACEDLLNFAIDREDVKWLVSRLPEETTAQQRGKLEYELQLLKIISVGWSIPYFLENRRGKSRLMELFWASVQEFSNSISETTSLMTGRDINYFQTIKNRLDTYLAALSETPGITEPATLIGPEFAARCGDRDNVFALMAGTKMFSAAVKGVREYLAAIKMI